MIKWFSSIWESYKYRFVPWIVVNLKRKKKSEPSTVLQGQKDVHQDKIIVNFVSQQEDKILTDEELIYKLVTFYEQLSVLEKNVVKGDHADRTLERSTRAKQIMEDIFGYSIERRKSLVAENAGTGVFLSKGKAQRGSLIALYPGTVYLPSEPLFFPSLGNPFIFRCSDNVHIDGNDKFISKSIFKSCAARDKFHFDMPCCDASWLTPFPINPLNIGQYVNNQSKKQKNNVVYQEAQVCFSWEKDSSNPTSIPVNLGRYLPNVWANASNNPHPLRIVPLVAVQEINEGEEVLSSYFTLLSK